MISRGFSLNNRTTRLRFTSREKRVIGSHLTCQEPNWPGHTLQRLPFRSKKRKGGEEDRRQRKRGIPSKLIKSTNRNFTASRGHSISPGLSKAFVDAAVTCRERIARRKLLFDRGLSRGEERDGG